MTMPQQHASLNLNNVGLTTWTQTNQHEMVANKDYFLILTLIYEYNKEIKQHSITLTARLVIGTK